MVAVRLCRCGAIVADGAMCEQCRPAGHQGTTKQRGYGHDWRKFSERKRDREPLCRVCDVKGRATPADAVHHVEKIKDAPHLRLDDENTVSVCEACHPEIEGMSRIELATYLEQLEAQYAGTKGPA